MVTLLADVAPSAADPTTWITVGVVLVVVVLMALALRKVMRRGRPPEPPKLQSQTQVPPALTPKVEAPALPKVTSATNSPIISPL